jgi:hypothetical protein
MDRYWLLTWTTYGTWLPGDRRGFVSPVRDGTGKYVRHNVPGTPQDSDIPALEKSLRNRLAGPPIYLNLAKAEQLLDQFHETADTRGWLPIAIGIIPNHCHIVVGVPGDPDPEILLRDFKSYGSRSLSKRWLRPVSGTWWTESGSKRKLPNREAVLAASAYVRDQEGALIIWIEPTVLAEIGERR